MKKHRVMLIQPPTSVKKGAVFNSSFPLGLAYISSFLERELPEVETYILDATIEKPQIRDVDSTGKFDIWGMSDEEIKRKIAEISPIVVGVSCLFSNQHSITIKMAKLAKEVDHNIVTVLGGAHPSAAIHEVLKDSEVDFVVRGPGEETFTNLVSCIINNDKYEKIKSIAYRDNGEIIINPLNYPTIELDSLPFPNFKKLLIDKYAQVSNYSAVKPVYPPAIPIITARGCPHKCIFCYVRAFWGNTIRYRSTRNVLEEIELLRANYDIDEIHIMDDNFGYQKNRTYQLLDGVKTLGIKKIVPINGSTLVALQDREFLEKLRKLGYNFLRVYIESASQNTLKKMKKPHNLDIINNIISLAREYGFLLYGSYMLGFPWQMIDDMVEEVALAQSLDVDYWSFNSVVAFPGTQLYTYCQSNNLLVKNMSFDEIDLYSGNISTPNFTNIDVEKICKKAFIDINFSSQEKIQRATQIFNVSVETIMERKKRAEFFLSKLQ